jgi:hypothetical protein
MSPTPPAWLVKRGGNLKLASDNTTWFVLIGDQLNYSLRPVPVQGKIGCAIRQTVNGRRIPCTATYTTEAEAVRNGLEDLRAELGWM